MQHDFKNLRVPWFLTLIISLALSSPPANANFVSYCLNTASELVGLRKKNTAEQSSPQSGDAKRQYINDAELGKVLDYVRNHCKVAGQCSQQQWKAVLSDAIEKHAPRSKTLLRSTLTWSSRTFYMISYGAINIAPGVITGIVTKQAGGADLTAILVGVGVNKIFEKFFGGWASPIDGRVFPFFEQAAFKIWDPNDADSWAKIKKELNDMQRFVSSQEYNQIVVIRDHIRDAGRALEEWIQIPGDSGAYRSAVRHYAAALVLATGFFNGLHIYKPETITDVRSFLPETFLHAAPEVKAQLIVDICKELHATPADQVPRRASRELLVRYGLGGTLRWFILPLEPQGIVLPAADEAPSEALPLTESPDNHL